MFCVIISNQFFQMCNLMNYISHVAVIILIINGYMYDYMYRHKYSEVWKSEKYTFLLNLMDIIPGSNLKLC